jgi:hypothetical protein
MDIVGAGIKKLTQNDHSWLDPKSRSHQSGINLPLKQFSSLFPEIYGAEGSPRVRLYVKWFDITGKLLASTDNEVVWYNTKRELRLLGIDRGVFSKIASTGSLVAIYRRNSKAEIRPVPESMEPILEMFKIFP